MGSIFKPKMPALPPVQPPPEPPEPELSDEEKCEVAFKKTNTIDKAWWTNEGVTKMFGGDACRSTSTGDMVLIGTKKYKCAFIGWELV